MSTSAFWDHEPVEYGSGQPIYNKTEGTGLPKSGITYTWLAGNIFVTGFLLAVGLLTAMGIHTSLDVPLVSLTGTIYSSSAGTGAAYYDLSAAGALLLDLTTLPTTVDPNHLNATIFPINLGSTCEIRTGMEGDKAISSQDLLVVEVGGSSNQIASIGVQSDTLSVIPIRLNATICSLLLAVLHGLSMLGCLSPLWSDNMLERILRANIILTFFAMQIFGMLIMMTLMGVNDRLTLILQVSWACADAILLGALFYVGLFSNNRLHAKDEINVSKSIVRVTVMGTTALLLSEMVRVVFTGFKVLNWGFSSVLLDWSGLYTPRISMINSAAVWFLTVGNFVVVLFPFTIITRLDKDGLLAKLSPTNPEIRTAEHLATKLRVLIFMDMILCFVWFIFNVLVYYGNMVTVPLAC